MRQLLRLYSSSFKRESVEIDEEEKHNTRLFPHFTVSMSLALLGYSRCVEAGSSTQDFSPFMIPWGLLTRAR